MDESNLTTKATLKAYVDPQITGTNADSMLDALINRASNLIVDQLQDIVIVHDTAVTEKRNGLGNAAVILRRRPAQSVTSVAIGLTVVPQSSNGSAGWVFDIDTNAVSLIGYCFTRGVQNVTIAYVCGIPASHRWLGMLEQACLVTCALWWKRRGHIDQITMAAPGGLGTLSYTQRDIPPEAQTIIDEIKRVATIFA
jgi:hypothetical protein